MSGPIDTAAIGVAYDAEISRAALDAYSDRLTAMRLDRQRVDALVAIARSEITAALPLTESPIERDLLPWLVIGAYRAFHVSPVPVFRPDRDPVTLSIYNAVLVPQFEVGRFRLDFALCLRRPGGLKVVAVECDGRDFHDTARDAMRDLALRAAGITTVRATGSEIRRDPTAVVYRLDDALLASDMEARAA